jgi:hypothetical protein
MSRAFLSFRRRHSCGSIFSSVRGKRSTCELCGAIDDRIAMCKDLISDAHPTDEITVERLVCRISALRAERAALHLKEAPGLIRGAVEIEHKARK